MKIEALENLARDMVGDGKTPNVFFVSKQPQGLVLVTRDEEAAYNYWQSLPRNVETSLEDRSFGVIASTEPREEGSTQLVTHDDYYAFTRLKKKRKAG